MSKNDDAGGRPNLSRRALRAGAGALGLTAVAARAQVTGIMPGGGTVPFRLPMGALDYLDRNQYIHNMELLTHVEGARRAGGEPQMSMYAKGERRLMQGRGGGLDVTDAKKPQKI